MHRHTERTRAGLACLKTVYPNMRTLNLQERIQERSSPTSSCPYWTKEQQDLSVAELRQSARRWRARTLSLSWPQTWDILKQCHQGHQLLSDDSTLHEWNKVSSREVLNLAVPPNPRQPWSIICESASESLEVVSETSKFQRSSSTTRLGTTTLKKQRTAS